MKNIVLPISVIFNVILIISLIVMGGDNNRVTEENVDLFEYVDANREFQSCKYNYEKYTKNWDDAEKYKSNYYFDYKKSEERFNQIKGLIDEKYFKF